MQVQGCSTRVQTESVGKGSLSATRVIFDLPGCLLALVDVAA